MRDTGPCVLLFLALALAPAACSSGGDSSGSGGSSSASSSTTGGSPDTSAVSGTLGALGAAQPIVSSFVITNSGETLVYLSTAPITCDTLQVSRWLGSLPTGSQVVELVLPDTPTVGTAVPVQDGEGEVNFAEGGKSSAYETGAASGSITFTRSDAEGVAEGYFDAVYDDGSAITGTFHADFCANGQGY